VEEWEAMEWKYAKGNGYTVIKEIEEEDHDSLTFFYQ
jgi:hypothetical protein